MLEPESSAEHCVSTIQVSRAEIYVPSSEKRHVETYLRAILHAEHSELVNSKIRVENYFLAHIFVFI